MDVPSILSTLYPQSCAANTHLQSLSLPGLLYEQKQNSCSISIIVPASKADVDTLTKEWSRWSLGNLSGCRIAPVAIHSHLQVDGILFSDTGDMKDVKKEFELKIYGPCNGPDVACINCQGKHRADSHSCSKRKELAFSLAAAPSLNFLPISLPRLIRPHRKP
ncbi:hypothetical protein B0H12DRAFT_398505 [Mycena haematopus]|nr:hypothetical protein B0H12DRAFT_398505 [Mycena haematopus]